MLETAVYNRIVAALNHEEGDRVPIWDYLDNRAVVERIAPDEHDYDRAMVRVYHTLGIDLCRGWGASYSEADNQEENAEATRRVAGRSNWATRYPVSSIEELKAFEPARLDPDWIENAWLGHARKMQEMLAPLTMYVPGAGCGFHDTYGQMGQALFSYAIYDAPADLERVMEVFSDNCAALAEAAAQAKLCPIYFIGDDIAYKGRLLFSPEYLRRTLVPMLRRCCEPLRNAGIKVVYHSDGNIMEVLDDLLDAGIDGLNPIEPLAGMDIGLLKRRYGRNLVLVGNVDCSQVLPLGSVEDVVQAARECIRAASPGGGHFIGSSSEIVPCTPVDNILAFYDACRRYGQYPIRA